MYKYEADIVVIAGGPSGLSAAVQAAEEGADVIVVEKTGAAGGAANMGMGPLGIGTKYQLHGMMDIDVKKAFNMFMDYTHWNADARLVKRYFEQSAETIEWLEDMGVEFEGAFRYFPKSEATWHIVKTDHEIGPRAASNMIHGLFRRAESLGVKILLETPAQKILKEDGKVCGVTVRGKDGELFDIGCKAAIICTGGAGDNPEMIRQETGYIHGTDMFNFAIPGIMGDGLRMAWEAGADKLPVRIEQAASLVGIGDLPADVSLIFMQPNLLVNYFGKRFMNEDQMQNTTFLSNAVSHQKKRSGFSIVDTSIVREYMRNGVDNISLVFRSDDVSGFMDGVRQAQQSGNDNLYIADSIEELAAMIGIDADALAATVETYNEGCRCGNDEFFKPERFLRPLERPPYYAARICPGGYGTVGGIRINENCEACDSDFAPIPGLYAAGADACNIYDDSYMFLLPGNSMGFAVNTGRIAGMSAAAYIGL